MPRVLNGEPRQSFAAHRSFRFDGGGLMNGEAYEAENQRFYDQYLAGTLDGPEGDKVPNITPHRDDGIGKWDQDDLAWFLQSGELPDGDYTGGLMTAVIDHATAKLTDADRRMLDKAAGKLAGGSLCRIESHLESFDASGEEK